MLQSENGLALDKAQHDEQGSAPIISNTENLLLLYPKCPGNLLRVGGQKNVFVNTMRGMLRAKLEQNTFGSGGPSPFALGMARDG